MTPNFHGIVTAAPRMAALFRLIERVADSDASVLIRGETGTGKELVARALHRLSPRRDGPFVALNCATLTPEMLASELFGHVKGAYTGAVRDRPGALRRANQGTLFLDEIAELPLDLQAQMLRVLQEQRFTPLGGSDPVTVDVRFLSATHQALREAVRARRFREDLMYRVRVVPLYLPRLAERAGDVEVLLWHFVGQFNQRGRRQIVDLEADARDALLAYPWPGNVRELRNAVEHAFVVGVGPTLARDDLPPELRCGVGAVDLTLAPEDCDEGAAGVDQPKAVVHGAAERSPESEEARRIRQALRASQWRKAEAAAALGVSRSTLWRRMRALGIGTRT